MENYIENTCFFTGHRTIPKKDMTHLTSLLDSKIRELIDDGCVNFICGGAVGFDTLAACRVIVAQKHFPEVKLTLLLPCRDQTARWKNGYDIALYQRIKGYAEKIIYASDTYTSGCMHQRNRMMADMSRYCVAYYNNSGSGGTAYTVRYARETGKTVINLHDILKMNDEV